jgi:Sec34-like family
VSGSVAELYSRYYDAEFFEEDALGAEVQRVSLIAVQCSSCRLLQSLHRVYSIEQLLAPSRAFCWSYCWRHCCWSMQPNTANSAGGGLHTAAGAVMLQPSQYSSTSTLLSVLTCKPACFTTAHVRQLVCFVQAYTCTHTELRAFVLLHLLFATHCCAHTQRVEQLSSFDEQCAEFEQQVSRAVALLEAIRAAQEQVSAKTSSLHSTCERLLTEERVSILNTVYL